MFYFEISRSLSDYSNFFSDRGKHEKIPGGIYLISESTLTSEDKFFVFNEEMGKKGIIRQTPGRAHRKRACCTW